jgi:UDP-N-acetylglucosamine--N-acetylmuramyl-(pentapeptide) pyrophosphoryl-undecaprenol N-acetylglucosamine transferase
MRFVIAAGGTGGHLFPGLAVAEVLHAKGHEVMILTSEKHIDAIATEGRSEFKIERLPGIGMPRAISFDAFKFLFRFATAVKHCGALFSEYQPSAVLGMGGFTSTAPIVAGKLRGLPVFVHESNAIPGKANRLNSRICGGMLVGFDALASRYDSQKCVVTGTPIRRALVSHPGKKEARVSFGLNPDFPTVLVMGGSQGASGINRAMVDCAIQLGGRGGLPPQFIHLTGATDESAVREVYQKAGVRAWVGAFHHAMQDAYSAADLAVARSGAASLTELAFFKLPSILIPYPFAADDHQTRNAEIFSHAGAGVLLAEAEADGRRLADEIIKILDRGVHQKMAGACERLNRTDAAERVAEVLLQSVGVGG